MAKEKAPKWVERTASDAWCLDCPIDLSNGNPSGSAALHAKATGHSCEAETTVRVVYGPAALEMGAAE